MSSCFVSLIDPWSFANIFFSVFVFSQLHSYCINFILFIIIYFDSLFICKPIHSFINLVTFYLLFLIISIFSYFFRNHEFLRGSLHGFTSTWCVTCTKATTILHSSGAWVMFLGFLLRKNCRQAELLLPTAHDNRPSCTGDQPTISGALLLTLNWLRASV